MSSNALPITPARFAAALNDLPISSLYGKHAELSNQIAHLEDSNRQLMEFARDNDDRDCYEALMENREVMKRFEERREMIVKEVREVRGLPWRPQGEEEITASVGVNGVTAAASGAGAEVAQERRNGEGGEDGVFL